MWLTARCGKAPQGSPDSCFSLACRESTPAGANYPGPAGESASSPLTGRDRSVLPLVPSSAPARVCACACVSTRGRRGGRNCQSADGAGAPPGRTSQGGLGNEWDLLRGSQPLRQGEVVTGCHHVALGPERGGGLLLLTRRLSAQEAGAGPRDVPRQRLQQQEGSEL